MIQVQRSFLIGGGILVKNCLINIVRRKGLSKVTPILSNNIGKPIGISLGKRVEDIHEYLTIKCPNCGEGNTLFSDPAEIEYGSFFLPEECWDCGQEYDLPEYKLKAYIVIEEK